MLATKMSLIIQMREAVSEPVIEMLVTISTKPVKHKGFISIGSTMATVEVSHVMRTSSGNYVAKAVNLKRDAPYDSQPWLNFRKNQNKHVKLPVLTKVHAPFNLQTQSYDEA